MFIEKNAGGIPFFTPFDDYPFCRAAITTRAGGVSEGHLAALNLGTGCGDAPENVKENVRRLSSALGFSPERIVRTKQEHTAQVRRAREADAGCGSILPRFPEGVDGLITNEENLPLLAYFADCVPVLFCDPVQKAVGVCHSGWRGTVAKIAAETVFKMQNEFGTNPADLAVAIGPHIGPCCFLVDAPVFREFCAAFPMADSFCEKKGEKYAIDLSAAVRETLRGAGVENITDMSVCTACESETFFSHRKTGGKRGCFGAVIWITEE